MQRVERRGPSDLVVFRELDFGKGPLSVRLEIHLRPPLAYDVRVYMAHTAFGMTFEFLRATSGCDIIVTVRDEPQTPAADPKFRADTLSSVAANMDDYIPAMERELAPRTE